MADCRPARNSSGLRSAHVAIAGNGLAFNFRNRSGAAVTVPAMDGHDDDLRDHLAEIAAACARSRAHLAELAASIAKTRARVESALAEQAKAPPPRLTDR